MQDRPTFLLLCLVLITFGLGSGLGSGLDGFGPGLERGSDAGEQLARVGIEREGDIPLPAHG
jgi:hypothetical protein